nr:MAG TPA: hypothetical protein [Caudoviricetes sp.]
MWRSAVRRKSTRITAKPQPSIRLGRTRASHHTSCIGSLSFYVNFITI